MSSIKFNPNDVLPQLSIVVGNVAQKNLIAIFDNVLLETKKDGEGGYVLLLTTSDNSTWLSMKARLEDASDENIRVCVDAKKLLQALKGLSGRVITIDIDESKHTFNGKYDNGKFTLPFSPADDFASFVESEENTTTKFIHANVLEDAINGVEFAVASDELRPIMNGVHFDFLENELSVAASDGLKLSRYTDASVKTEQGENPLGFTFPKNPAHLLANILSREDGDVKIVFDERSAVINNKQFKLATRLIEGRYPNYNRVIPTDNHNKAIVDCEALLGALGRVLSLGNNKSELLVLTFAKEELTIKAENVDFSTSASEVVPCKFSGDVEYLTIGFKGSILIDIVKNIEKFNSTGQVEISLKEANRAGLFKPYPHNEENGVDYLSLQMPMLLDA